MSLEMKYKIFTKTKEMEVANASHSLITSLIKDSYDEYKMIAGKHFICMSCLGTISNLICMEK